MADVLQCIVCEEPVDPPRSNEFPANIHRECGLRTAIGGIGHLLDHDHFCIEKQDTDAGLDVRTSSILASVLFARAHGVTESE